MQDDRELFDMIDEISERDDHSVRLWVRQAGYEVYPSLAMYWRERLGREGVCQSQASIQASSS